MPTNSRPGASTPKRSSADRAAGMRPSPGLVDRGAAALDESDTQAGEHALDPGGQADRAAADDEQIDVHAVIVTAAGGIA